MHLRAPSPEHADMEATASYDRSRRWKHVWSQQEVEERLQRDAFLGTALQFLRLPTHVARRRHSLQDTTTLIREIFKHRRTLARLTLGVTIRIGQAISTRTIGSTTFARSRGLSRGLEGAIVRGLCFSQHSIPRVLYTRQAARRRSMHVFHATIRHPPRCIVRRACVSPLMSPASLIRTACCHLIWIHRCG
jgi:hypothetical protein